MPEEQNQLPDNPSEAELEQATNLAFADSLDSPQSRAISPDASTEATKEPPAPGSPAAPITPQAGSSTQGQVDWSDEEKALLTELRAMKEITGTPFKSPGELVKSYKELQSTWTKDREALTRIKPYEQYVSKASTNPDYARFLEQATQMFDNPQLAAPYLGPQGQADAPPDPRNYDMYDAEQYQQYQTDLTNFQARQVDERLNARFAQSDAKARLESEKTELKRIFPDCDPDNVIERIRERAKKGWSLIDGYKVLEYDQMETKAMAKARSETNQKLQEAGQTQTPAPSAANREQISFEDIITHINKYGPEAARKKFGDKNYGEAIRVSAEMAMS